MSVSRAQQEISAREFAEWMAFFSVEPMPNTRADYNAAALRATIINANGGINKKPVQAADLVPDYWKPTAESDPEAEAKARSDMIKRLVFRKKD